MNKNKIIIYVTVLLCILLISVPLLFKIMNDHNSKLEQVAIKKIVETAKNCYYSESCVEDKITLLELSDKAGLEIPTNPKTKKLYNDTSYVSVKDNFEFIKVE